MSIALMSEVWKSNLPMTEKMVLLCLADFANDRGECWPSIDTIADKCSCSDRTVQKAIKSLREMGILIIQDKPGRSHQFQIEGRKLFTPENSSPPKISAKGVKNIHHGGERASPKPSITTTRTIIEEEAKASPSLRARAASNPFPKPDWANGDVWADFLANRKRKRLPNTATAHRGLLADIAKFTDDDWPPGRLLEHATAKGWAAIYEPDERKGGKNGTAIRAGSGASNPDRRSSRARAIDAALEYLGP